MNATKRMKAIINGRIVLPDALVAGGMALLYDEQIKGLCDPAALPEGCEIIDAKGMYIAPGLVDVHIHGYLGEDTSDGRPEGIRKMAKGILANGVTSWLPTTMTVERKQMCDVFDMMRSLRDESKTDAFVGAEILGVHAEGPFINESRKGAQKADNIQLPDAALVRAYADIIRLITIAPEVTGAIDFIEDISKNTSVVLSMGHTDATFEQAMDAVWHGISHVTHIFNAMTSLMHRAPGVVGAALTSPVTAELIADTFHVHPGLFPLLCKAKGDKLVLVTDCTRAGGMPDGEYDLGGQKIFVKGIECRLEDGTIAGSVLKLNNAVANVRANTDLPIFDVFNLASLNPANAIGETRKGALLEGRDADIILCDEELRIHRTIVRGHERYRLDA